MEPVAKKGTKRPLKPETIKRREEERALAEQIKQKYRLDAIEKREMERSEKRQQKQAQRRTKPSKGEQAAPSAPPVADDDEYHIKLITESMTTAITGAISQAFQTRDVEKSKRRIRPVDPPPPKPAPSIRRSKVEDPVPADPKVKWQSKLRPDLILYQ